MKVYFNNTDIVPFSELIIYNRLNRIPFTLKLSDGQLRDTIYTRNLFGKNFIELRFDQNTKQLYEITLVAVQNDTVKLEEYKASKSAGFFNCYIDEDEKLIISESMQILRSNKSLSFVWGNQESKSYRVTQNCFLGVDDNNYVCSISLTDLTAEAIFEILGF